LSYDQIDHTNAILSSGALYKG